LPRERVCPGGPGATQAYARVAGVKGAGVIARCVARCLPTESTQEWLRADPVDCGVGRPLFLGERVCTRGILR